MTQDTALAKPDIERPFGHYQPDLLSRRWLRLAQLAPRHYLGQQLVRLARSKVLDRHGEPLDIVVQGIRLRSYFAANHTEKKFIFTPRRFDRRERQWLSEHLPTDGVFVDIGANAGIYTLLAAQQMSPNGRIIALEPFPALYQRLCFNVDVNAALRTSRWPRVDCLPLGVADCEATLDLHVDSRNLGESSLLQPAAAHTEGVRVSINCRLLLAIFQAQGVSRVDMLKIDIEGAEDLALCPFLASADDSLLPGFILIEDSAGKWQADLPAALAMRGYHSRQRAGRNILYQRVSAGQ